MPVFNSFIFVFRLFILTSALCTLHSALCTLHSALCTLHSALCILTSLFSNSRSGRRGLCGVRGRTPGIIFARDTLASWCYLRSLCDAGAMVMPERANSQPASTAMGGMSKSDKVFVVIRGGDRRPRPTTERHFFAVHKPDHSSNTSRPDRFAQGCRGSVEGLEWPQKRVQAPLEKRVASPHILLSFTRVKVIPLSHLQQVPEPRGSGPGLDTNGAPVSRRTIPLLPNSNR